VKECAATDGPAITLKMREKKQKRRQEDEGEEEE
jgi:hypothetical protein